MSTTEKTHKFTLDRERLRTIIQDEYGGAEHFDSWEDGGLAGAISQRVYGAQEALNGPSDIEIQTYPTCDESVIVCVRERKPALLRQPLRQPLRQVASYSIESKHLMGGRGDAYEEHCEMLEKVLSYANGLVPSLRALQACEGAEQPVVYQMPEVTVYHGTDGAVVVEIDTPMMGDALHDPGMVPYLRVYVNDGLIHDQGPAGPIPGSPAARGKDADPDAPIGRLIVERSNRMEA